MKNFLTLFSLLAFSLFANAQSDWPKSITTSDGAIVKMYQMQPESFSGNQLKYRSAFSVQDNASADPVFGTFWALATVETDRDNRVLSILSVKIPNIRSADDSASDQLGFIKSELENQIPVVASNLQLDPILSSLEMRTEEKKVSKDLNNNPPKIIYSNHPSSLVLIDGTPQFQYNADWGVNAVVNSPFTIVKDNNLYYLYGGNRWFYANEITGPYKYTGKIPSNLKKVETAIKNVDTNSDPGYTTTSKIDQSGEIPEIIVSTVPAELIQTKGPADFKTIEGTNLLYASNSDNDIFVDNTSRNYYVLVSGRWYKSESLQNAEWKYIASSELPSDFAKIPEGSTKDNVLASVSGTDEAREAVMDAQIPQTAKVDRKNASTTVTYDGDPNFESIQGTSMQYAVNSQNSVIRYRDRYYCVENGVWFDAPTARGPWSVSVERPEEVDIIPPSYPVYNMKYVYIYDVSPEWVYMGYTPGYLNAFIYGPTVVYGTGYYYTPWMGRYYYPRPHTWGFSMHYNPWTGWDLGYYYSYGWFNIGFGSSCWHGWHGGWWGPVLYHPPYRWNPRGRDFGYYGRRVERRNNSYLNNNNHGIRRASNNIYNYRRDVVTYNNNRTNILRNDGINRTNRPNNGMNNQPRNNTNQPRNQQNQSPQNIQHNVNPGIVRPNINPPRNSTTPQNIQHNVNPGTVRPNINPPRNNTVPQNNPQNQQQHNPGTVRPDNNMPRNNTAPQQNNPQNQQQHNNNPRTGMPGTTNTTPGNNVVSDHDGNVFRNQQGQWQQNQQRQWQPVKQEQRPQVVQNLNRQQQMQQRGETRSQNFQTQRNAVIRQTPSGNTGRSGGNNQTKTERGHKGR